MFWIFLHIQTKTTRHRLYHSFGSIFPMFWLFWGKKCWYVEHRCYIVFRAVDWMIELTFLFLFIVVIVLFVVTPYNFLFYCVDSMAICVIILICCYQSLSLFTKFSTKTIFIGLRVRNKFRWWMQQQCTKFQTMTSYSPYRSYCRRRYLTEYTSQFQSCWIYRPGKWKGAQW